MILGQREDDSMKEKRRVTENELLALLNRRLSRGGPGAVPQDYMAFPACLDSRVSEDPDESGEEHVVEDENLMGCLSAGVLTKAERKKIAEHLRTCPLCLRDFLWLVKVGAVSCNLRDLDLFDRSPWVFRFPPIISLVVMANLLVGLIWFLAVSPQTTLIAEAREALQAGQYERVLELAELIRKQRTNLDSEVTMLVEESSYQLARGSLRRGDFEAVFRLQERIAPFGAESGRLRNLVLQAQRGITAEQALETSGTLLDLGYDLHGRSLTKCLISARLGPSSDENPEILFAPTAPLFPQEVPSIIAEIDEPAMVSVPEIPPQAEEPSTPSRFEEGASSPADVEGESSITESSAESGQFDRGTMALLIVESSGDSTTRRLLSEYQQALERFPNDTTLLLNYAHLRLCMGDVYEAQDLFSRVLSLDPQSWEALIGLGLVAFKTGEVEEAAQYFLQALKFRPHCVQALLNLAICYEALNQPAQARDIWQKLLGQTIDRELRVQIEAHLQAKAAPE